MILYNLNVVLKSMKIKAAAKAAARSITFFFLLNECLHRTSHEIQFVTKNI